MPSPTPARRVLYGRRTVRRLPPRRRQLLETVLPARRITLPEQPERLNPAGLFTPPAQRVWLEIGFGNGEHLAEQARRHDDTAFIGCEPYHPGIAALLSVMEAESLDNIRIHDGDGRDILASLTDESIERIFVLFPDPWPKTRHHRRRLIAPAVIDDIARILVPGGTLRIAVDLPDHLRWILTHLRRCPALEWTARTPADWRQRPPDWPATRYERKALAAGRQPIYLQFQRMKKPGEFAGERAAFPLRGLSPTPPLP